MRQHLDILVGQVNGPEANSCVLESAQSSCLRVAPARAFNSTTTTLGLRWTICGLLQNDFGPPATWLSRSRVTRHLGGEWTLVGDKGVIIAGGPLNIGGNNRRDDGDNPLVAATDRVRRRNFRSLLSPTKLSTRCRTRWRIRAGSSRHRLLGQQRPAFGWQRG